MPSAAQVQGGDAHVRWRRRRADLDGSGRYQCSGAQQMQSLIPLGFFLLLLAIIVAALVWSVLGTPAVHGYRFSDEIGASLKSKYPHLSTPDCAEILAAVRDAYLIAAAEATTPALPSLAVAHAWTALPGDSRYRKRLTLLGPCAAVQPGFVAEGQSSDALSTTWRLCCEREEIDQHFPGRLPRLFALDARLAIPGGSRYCIEADNQPPGDPLSPKRLRVCPSLGDAARARARVHRCRPWFFRAGQCRRQLRWMAVTSMLAGNDGSPIRPHRPPAAGLGRSHRSGLAARADALPTATGSDGLTGPHADGWRGYSPTDRRLGWTS